MVRFCLSVVGQPPGLGPGPATPGRGGPDSGRQRKWSQALTKSVVCYSRLIRYCKTTRDNLCPSVWGPVQKGEDPYAAQGGGGGCCSIQVSNPVRSQLHLGSMLMVAIPLAVIWRAPTRPCLSLVSASSSHPSYYQPTLHFTFRLTPASLLHQHYLRPLATIYPSPAAQPPDPSSARAVGAPPHARHCPSYQHATPNPACLSQGSTLRPESPTPFTPLVFLGSFLCVSWSHRLFSILSPHPRYRQRPLRAALLQKGSQLCMRR